MIETSEITPEEATQYLVDIHTAYEKRNWDGPDKHFSGIEFERLAYLTRVFNIHFKEIIPYLDAIGIKRHLFYIAATGEYHVEFSGNGQLWGMYVQAGDATDGCRLLWRYAPHQAYQTWPMEQFISTLVTKMKLI